jgi:predicted RNA methylase
VGKYEFGFMRVPKDLYPTPAWVIGALAQHIDLADKIVWECAVGTGQMSETLKAVGAARVYSTDVVDHGYSGLDEVFDFLSAGEPKLTRFDAITSNPPYGPRGTLAEIHRGWASTNHSRNSSSPAAERF